MALKKPSEFFGKNKNDFDNIKDTVSAEKIETVSEAFSAFKTNLNHIQSISDFSDTVENFKENVDRVDSISKEISEVKEDIRGLISKEDLDEAMVAHLLFVEESIKKIEGRIKSVNGDTIDKIKEDFTNLSQTVENFVDVDIPNYKKLVSESEIRFDTRLASFKGVVEEDLDGIREDVNKEVSTALAGVETVNENIVSDLKKDLRKTTKDINETVSNLVNEEFPKYKKLFAETELKTEQRVSAYDEVIEKLTLMVNEFTENEIPKYSNLLVETKIKSEKEVKELEENVLGQVQSLTDKINTLSSDVVEKTSDIDSLVEEKVKELQSTIEDSKQQIGDISNIYMSLYRDFKDREVHENRKLEEYQQEIDKFSKKFSVFEEFIEEDVRELQSVLEDNTNKYYDSLKTEVDGFKENLTSQIKDFELNIVVNEEHIKKQNANIDSIRDEVKDVIERLKIDSLEQKNESLLRKVDYIETVLKEFNEKSLLTEDNPTLPGDPKTNNSADPLTPLDQNFVTLDQLQNHYKLFINRIQQQIATIGGGGAGFIKDLDDVTFDESTGTNELLIYNGSKWVGIASTAIQGTSNAIAGVGIQSGTTRVGTGFTDIKFVGSGVSSVTGSGTTISINIPGTNIKRQVNTSSGITTNFTITGGYKTGFIDVFLNGVKQRSGTDFTATSGTTVTMTPFVNDGDVLEFQVYEALSVSNNATRDQIQGYYGYTTDYYTVGVANTTQEIGAGTTTMIMPQVASDGINQHLPTIMTGVGTNPYVGTAATVGTGQTEFSLAGLGSGASCIVRTALAFNPDEDNTNLDVQLKFTTNTATQGTGLTNFTIKKEQALIMNEGADQQYISENLFSFFVGATLEGTTYDNAGTFRIEVIPSNDGVLEVLAVTVNVVA